MLSCKAKAYDKSAHKVMEILHFFSTLHVTETNETLLHTHEKNEERGTKRGGEDEGTNLLQILLSLRVFVLPRLLAKRLRFPPKNRIRSDEEIETRVRVCLSRRSALRGWRFRCGR